ncbi:MAG: transposase domain-containing protein, partial [Gemmatimonas sp.]
PRRDRQDVPHRGGTAGAGRDHKASERERDLPAHVMIYYAIALSLYMSVSTREVLRCLLEGLRWL